MWSGADGTEVPWQHKDGIRRRHREAYVNEVDVRREKGTEELRKLKSTFYLVYNIIYYIRLLT